MTNSNYPCPRCLQDVGPDSTHCPSCGQPIPDREDPPEAWVGREIDGKYEVMRVLGVGGMGMVFAARRILVGDEIALKVLFPRFLESPLQRRLFTDEAKAAARLVHPNVITVYDAELASKEGCAYIAMELLRGQSLKAYLKELAPMPPKLLLPLFVQICDGLSAAHAAHVVHRDLKPDNVFLEETPMGQRVKLVDFGIAAMLDAGEREHERQKLLGTIRYMAPEQCRREPIDGRTDLYGMGIMLYEGLTRKRATGSTISQVQNDPIKPPNTVLAQGSHLSPAVEALVMRLCSKDPCHRPASAATAKAEIVACIEQLGHPPPPPERTAIWDRFLSWLSGQ